MNKVNIRAFNNPKGYTNEEDVILAIAQCGQSIKHVCGIANSMAFLTMLDAIDMIKREGLYKQNTKRKFNDALTAHKKYESRLLNPSPGESEYFNLANLPEDRRRRYRADLTNKEYFQTWLDMGDASYSAYKPMIDALCHKYYKSLTEHNVKHAKAVAWAITTEVTLEIAVEAFKVCTKELAYINGLPLQFLRFEFQPFSLQGVQEAWCEALRQLYPFVEEYGLTTHENKNITIGINQLKEYFSAQISSVDAIRQSVEDNADIFATKGFYKKEMARIAETEQELINQQSA